jgi:8-oxo-dGTP pyrophosphatase MutT (NUDIX family)
VWTTLTATGGLVVLNGRLLMIRQRRAYGVFWEMPSGYHEPGESQWVGGETSFHLHADVVDRPDGTQEYRFRS